MRQQVFGLGFEWSRSHPLSEQATVSKKYFLPAAELRVNLTLLGNLMGTDPIISDVAPFYSLEMRTIDGKERVISGTAPENRQWYDSVCPGDRVEIRYQVRHWAINWVAGPRVVDVRKVA